jgi:hypothetical protein
MNKLQTYIFIKIIRLSIWRLPCKPSSTLRLEDQLVEQAKSYAAQAGKSVSQIVAEYFKLITTQNIKTNTPFNTNNAITSGIIAGIKAG